MSDRIPINSAFLIAVKVWISVWSAFTNYVNTYTVYNVVGLTLMSYLPSWQCCILSYKGQVILDNCPEQVNLLTLDDGYKIIFCCAIRWNMTKRVDYLFTVESDYFYSKYFHSEIIRTKAQTAKYMKQNTVLRTKIIIILAQFSNI